ncbi:hypothetical protein [Dyella sp.]|uniref:hypothetical protein n=1 Tax=Dyella sp. TaxID=1869338 RepID=UPI002ED515CB
MANQLPLQLQVPPEFDAFCRGHQLTPSQVLAAFMADLAETADSNGSDERRLAEAWFDRVIWPEPEETTGRVYQAASGQWSWVIERGGEPLANGAGYATSDEAHDEMEDRLADY